MIPLFFLFGVLVVSIANVETFVPKNLTTMVRPALEINTGNHYKGRINKCEKEGIADIRRLNSPYEEFWAYIPTKCTWIELGILEQIRGTIRRDRYGNCRSPSTISGIKKADVIALIKEVNTLILYHPHPTNNTLVQHLATNKELSKFSSLCIKEARIETLEAALPGIPDLVSMLEFSRIFYRQHHDGIFAEKIVSTYGVTEYHLTTAGMNELKTGEFETLKRREMRKYFQVRNRLQAVDYAEEGAPKRNLEKLEILLKKINAEVASFVISFEPLLK